MHDTEQSIVKACIYLTITYDWWLNAAKSLLAGQSIEFLSSYILPIILVFYLNKISWYTVKHGYNEAPGMSDFDSL